MGKPRSTGRPCLVEGCGRFARRGHGVCGDHERTPEGREVERGVTQLTRMAEEAFGADGEEKRRTKALGRFQRALGRGDYGELTDGGLRRAIGQAAAEKGVSEELGVLRLALMRLAVELPGAGDPVPTANSIARVAGAAVRAARTQRELKGEDTSEFQAALFQALAELDAEEARRAAEEGAIEGGTLRDIGWEARPLEPGTRLDEGWGAGADGG